MRIAVIGAGFTGLSSAYELIKLKHEVSIFEKDPEPGGLAIGYKEKNWDWSLEKHYHHWFTNDFNILNLADEIKHDVVVKRPKTSVLTGNRIYQLDSPLSVLKFPLLSITNRIRMGTIIALLKLDPFWRPLEKYKASQTLPKLMGKNPYQMIWEPLFVNKFGEFAGNVSLAWFWARIRKRTPSLAYPKGGFLDFADSLVEEIKENGGKIFFKTEILELKDNGKISIRFKDSNGQIKEEIFDKAIVTVPSFLFLKISPSLPPDYKDRLEKLEGLGAISLILRLKKPFFKDGTYWLNVCEKNAPVMAIVEHTNFMDKENYNNEHIVYLGNYKPAGDEYFSLTKQELLEKFDPYLKRINPGYQQDIIDYRLFRAPFAQPVVGINHSKILPPLETPLKNVYLANIEQVYPWDRGTNYAVELGQKVAKLASKND